MKEGGLLDRAVPDFHAPTVHIAIVDDDDAVRETTLRLLEASLSDASTVGFRSGSELLDAMGSGDSVDVIVSDYEMPGMTGLELLEEVRERDADVPFIIYTGQGNEGVASEAISAGVTDYVRKSAVGGYDILVNRIQAAVSRRRVEAERDLQALAMATVEEGIAVVDENDVFVEVNRAYADTYGYDREELVGEKWERINPPQENERMYLQILPTLRSEGTWRGESVGLRSDGSTFVKSKALTALDDGGFVCAIRDVTEKRAAEDALREQNERLREFARLVSHDLRNPLNVAEGYLSLVEEAVDDELNDEVGRIKTAHDRMRRLIDDMLRLAHEGRVVSNPEVVSLAAIAEEAALSVGFEGESECLIDEDLPMLEADDERLSALLENLFGNALEHAGPNPTVRVGRLDESGSTNGFFVEDDGPGIPENRHVKVFESGFTTERTGTGFGLAIVKRIASAHGWTVSVRTSSSGGARFEFRGIDVVDDEDSGAGTTNEPVRTEDDDAVADGGKGDESADGSDSTDSK